MNPLSSVSTAKSVTSTGTSSDTVATQGDLDKDSFLKLLVTQMKNQDPTQPMDNQQLVAQLAQFSSLEQMTNVSQGVGDLNRLQAFGMAGKTVTLHVPDGAPPITGKVDEVRWSSDGPVLMVGGKGYGMSDVISVQGG